MKFYLPSSNQSDFKAVDPCVNQRLLKTHELHFSLMTILRRFFSKAYDRVWHDELLI